MPPFSDEIDRFPTTFLLLNNKINIENQFASASLPLLEVSSVSDFFCLKNDYVAFNINMMN